MFTVMLVDDEQLLREGMRKFIPWEEHGFQVKFEVSNGLEALHYLQRERIDLIFLDVRMPEMTGLELLAKLNGSLSNVHVVILSGFNEFDYAREAMRFHVTDYLLKPVVTDEVTALLRRIRHEKEQAILKQAESKRTLDRLLQAEWFRLQSDTDAIGSRQDLTERLTVHYPHHTYRIAFLPCIAPDLHDRTQGGLAEYFANMPDVETAIVAEKPHAGYFVLLVMNRANRQHEEWSERSEALLQMTPAMTGVVYSPLFKLESSETYFSNMYLSGMPLRLFYSGANLEYADVAISHSSYQLPESWTAELARLVSDNNRIHALQKLSELYFALRSSPNYAIGSVRAAYDELLQLVSKQAKTMVEKGAIDSWLETSLAQVRAAIRLKALHDAAGNRLSALFDQIDAATKNTSRRLIKEMKQFIRDHIAEPILLSDLAAHFRVSIEHLSYLFKKEEGINFNQYMKQLRVVTAKAIIARDCNIRIYELALAVGYQDAKHFSKVFRECTGMAPREYIERTFAPSDGGWPKEV